jgi:hypothetical protein
MGTMLALDDLSIYGSSIWTLHRHTCGGSTGHLIGGYLRTVNWRFLK